MALPDGVPQLLNMAAWPERVGIQFKAASKALSSILGIQQEPEYGLFLMAIRLSSLMVLLILTWSKTPLSALMPSNKAALPLTTKFKHLGRLTP